METSVPPSTTSLVYPFCPLDPQEALRLFFPVFEERPTTRLTLPSTLPNDFLVAMPAALDHTIRASSSSACSPAPLDSPSSLSSTTPVMPTPHPALGSEAVSSSGPSTAIEINPIVLLGVPQLPPLKVPRPPKYVLVQVVILFSILMLFVVA